MDRSPYGRLRHRTVPSAVTDWHICQAQSPINHQPFRHHIQSSQPIITPTSHTLPLNTKSATPSASSPTPALLTKSLITIRHQRETLTLHPFQHRHFSCCAADRQPVSTATESHCANHHDYDLQRALAIPFQVPLPFQVQHLHAVDRLIRQLRPSHLLEIRAKIVCIQIAKLFNEEVQKGYL